MRQIQLCEQSFVAGGTDPQPSLLDVYTSTFETVYAEMYTRPANQPVDFFCFNASYYVAGSVCRTVETAQWYIAVGGGTPGVSFLGGSTNSAEGVLEGWTLMLGARGVAGEVSLTDPTQVGLAFNIGTDLAGRSASVTYGVNATELLFRSIAMDIAEVEMRNAMIDRLFQGVGDAFQNYVAQPVNGLVQEYISQPIGGLLREYVVGPLETAAWNNMWSNLSIPATDPSNATTSPPPPPSIEVSAVLGAVIVTGSRIEDTLEPVVVVGSRHDSDITVMSEADYELELDMSSLTILTSEMIQTWMQNNPVGNVANPVPPGFQISPITGEVVPNPTLPGEVGLGGPAFANVRYDDGNGGYFYHNGHDTYHHTTGGDWLVASSVEFVNSGDAVDPSIMDALCEQYCGASGAGAPAMTWLPMSMSGWGTDAWQVPTGWAVSQEHTVSNLLAQMEAGVQLSQTQFDSVADYLLSMAGASAAAVELRQSSSSGTTGSTPGSNPPPSDPPPNDPPPDPYYDPYYPNPYEPCYCP